MICTKDLFNNSNYFFHYTIITSTVRLSFNELFLSTITFIVNHVLNLFNKFFNNTNGFFFVLYEILCMEFFTIYDN